MVELNHPNLGVLKGLLTQGNVRQFRNIPYAVAERFGSPNLRAGKLSSDVYDASQLGPTVQQPSFTMKGEMSLIQKELPSQALTASEKHGLNLVVTIPKEAVLSSKLPVFVWIHGGGFMAGSGNWAHYDHAAFISLSSKLGMPVIGVGINYRLGPLGFLTSSELSKAGLTGNYGLKDQRVALEWVQENISGFGGDPSQVTLVGHSAGGVSTTLQFYSTKSLFRQAVAMAGTSILMGPQPIQFHDALYPAFLGALGIDVSLPVDEKVRLLKAIPEEKWPTVPPNLPSRPVMDGSFIPEIPSFKGLQDVSHTVGKPSWLESAVFTDCKDDVTFLKVDAHSKGHILRFGFSKHKDIAATFASFLKANLPTELAARLLSGYGIVPHIDDADALTRILDIFSAVTFYAPAVVYSKAFEGRSYLLHFDQKNSFSGPLIGRASHILDAAYLFQNYNSYLNPDEVVVAEEFGKRVITFINGKEPWQKYDETGRALVLGDGGVQETNFLEYNGRNKEIWRITDEIGGDKLSSVLFAYMASAH